MGQRTEWYLLVQQAADQAKAILGMSIDQFLGQRPSHRRKRLGANTHPTDEEGGVEREGDGRFRIEASVGDAAGQQSMEGQGRKEPSWTDHGLRSIFVPSRVATHPT